jgi:hypothetical protein
MSNRTGSALALPGVAKSSPDVQANACKTATLTKLLVLLIRAPLVVFESRDSRKPSFSTTREGRKTPARFLYSQQISGAAGARVVQAVVALFSASFDIDVIRVPPDLGAKSVLQHGQQSFRTFRARLEGTADG